MTNILIEISIYIYVCVSVYAVYLRYYKITNSNKQFILRSNREAFDQVY